MRLIALFLLFANLAFFYWVSTYPPPVAPPVTLAALPADIPRLAMLSERLPADPLPTAPVEVALVETGLFSPPPEPAPMETALPEPSTAPLAAEPAPAEPAPATEDAPGGLSKIAQGLGGLTAGLARTANWLAETGSDSEIAPETVAETPPPAINLPVTESLPEVSAEAAPEPPAPVIHLPVTESQPAAPVVETAEVEVAPPAGESAPPAEAESMTEAETPAGEAAPLPAELETPAVAEAPVDIADSHQPEIKPEAETAAASPQAVTPPVQPEAKKIIASAQPAVKPAPAATPPEKTPRATAKPAAPAKPKTGQVCFRAGPYDGKASAEKFAKRLALASIPSQIREVAQAGAMAGPAWVYLPPLASLEAARAEDRRLDQLGIRDHYVITAPPLANAISLGVYRDENSVARRLAELRAKGYHNVAVQARQQARAVFWVEIALAAEREAALRRIGAGENLASAGCGEIAVGGKVP